MATKEYRRQYYLEHKEEIKKRYDAYYQENKERLREYNREYRKNNKERLSKRNREYTRANKERKREYDRRRRLKLGYSMSVEEYNEMLFRQKGGCAICGAKPPKNKSLHVDHNHTTGSIRELLCYSCNTSIGYAKEDVTILENMIKYLNKHNGR